MGAWTRCFSLTRFSLLVLAVGIVSCRAKLDVKKKSGGPLPAETNAPDQPEAAAEEEIPAPQILPKQGTSKPVREIVPSANNTVWQTRSHIKIQMSGDLAKTATDGVALKNNTTGLSLDHTQLTFETCGLGKCVMIPAVFKYEDTPFFAYGVNDLSLIAEGATEDLLMPYKLTIRDFTVFGSVDLVPSASTGEVTSILRPFGSGHVSVGAGNSTAVPATYFTAFWQEQVEHP